MQQHRRADANRVSLHSGNKRLRGPGESPDISEGRTLGFIISRPFSEVAQVVAGGEVDSLTLEQDSPCPWSLSALSRVSARAEYISLLSAFIFSGRANVSVSTPFDTSTLT